MLNHKKIDSKNRETYKKKTLIKLIYNNYYKNINQFIYKNKNQKILELGSGGGNIKRVIKNCITSDQFRNKNVDRIENIYKINLAAKNLIIK